MAGTTLGKRMRDVADTGALDCPAKRTRRSARLAEANDENADPKATESLSEIDEDVDVVPTPSTKRQYRTKSQKLTKAVPVTPQTPRHRDAFAKAPITPRHAVMSAGKLFRRMTPQTPLTPAAQQTVYHHARQLFARGADPGQLVGREEEKARLSKFVDQCSSSAASGCLYISGPPGTGKSAMVKEVTSKLTETLGVRQALHQLHEHQIIQGPVQHPSRPAGHSEDLNEAQAMAALQTIFVTSEEDAPVHLVVLDEIDHILTMGLESLYRLFEWSLQKPSRLVMVGIANALDLTDRFLPRLKSKNLKPDLLPFHPYSAAQIKSIITTRLKSLLPEGSQQTSAPFIHPAAIELCSRKVASQTGDLRKAFEICRRALDLIETETKEKHENEAREKMLQMTPSRKPLGETTNCASPTKGGSRSVAQIATSSLKALTAETAPRASIGHLNKVTQAAFSNGTNQRLKALNLQQKAALCALVALENRNRVARANSGLSTTPSKSATLAPTVKILFDTYTVLCTRDSVLHPLSSSEFREVVGSLETLGLVSPVEGKAGSFIAQTPSKRSRKGNFATGEERRVASCVGEKEMEQMTDGVGAGILKSIISGEALD
ncbi:cell division control protein [Verticillium alfalfae VaMs.102]|uniref:Cell division control protein n=1 Tax=Verticillium alfalfae (strain VaMs.102 / ATCC MYA-4576 / FGSC 10136) TaxID=526221 RepID=C9SIH6_VERA1|nr:cell division control protein [Verticillium alfalfae VaMs.102]EEY18749.1 cell division control protein [Verticillium alfalfae VaMs.102]